jgi:hypothetical protein
MLSSDIRTPVGVKVFGTDLGEMKRLARKIEQVLKTIAGTSSAYAERIIGVITSTSPLTGSHTFGLAWPRNAAGTTLPRVGAMVW